MVFSSTSNTYRKISVRRGTATSSSTRSGTTSAPLANVEFERLAVTPEQIEQYQLPTRPTKGTDTRSSGFEGESVEVDALPASVLRQIVGDAIEGHLDPRALALTRSVEASERDVLTSLIGVR